MNPLFPEDGESLVIPISMEKVDGVWQKKKKKEKKRDETFFIYDEVAPLEFKIFNAWTLGIPITRHNHGVVWAVSDCAPDCPECRAEMVDGKPNQKLSATGRFPTEPERQYLPRKQNK